MNLFFVSLLIILAGGISAALLHRHFSGMKLLGSIGIAVGCAFGAVDAALKLFQGILPSFSIRYLSSWFFTFRMDSLSAFFLVVIFAVCLLAAIYSFHYLNKPEKAKAVAAGYLFFSLLVVSMALVVTAHNMLAFMFAWEIMSLSSLFLVIHNFQSAENRKAGYLYFVFSHVGAMCILAAFGIIFGYTGRFDFGDMARLSETAKITVFVLAFVGFGSKAGVFPFHVWLPHAHPAAPSHVSAVMSGVMIKTGIYGILRIYGLLGLHTPLLGNLVIIAGMISGILGVVYALGQHDLKRLLAYSSVENIGIILIGIGIGMIGVATHKPSMAAFGFAGGLLHVLNHAVFKSLLFMGAGMVLKKTGTRLIDVLGGLLKNMKVTGITFIIGSIAISGLPPFNGFVSEFFVYIGGIEGIHPGNFSFVLCIAAIISLAVIGGLALACFTKVVGVVFQGEPRTAAAQNTNENGISMHVAMIVLAAICIIIGVLPKWFVLMAVKGISSLSLGYGRIPVAPFTELTGYITATALLFLIIIFLVLMLRAWLYNGKTVTRSATWGCGFTQPTSRMQYTGSSYADSILEFFKPVAPLDVQHPPIVGRFPAKTHYAGHTKDIAERHLKAVIVTPIMALFDRLRWIQHGEIHLYIGYILLAIIVLLFFI